MPHEYSKNGLGVDSVRYIVDSVRAVSFRAFFECYEWLELRLLSLANGHGAHRFLRRICMVGSC